MNMYVINVYAYVHVACPKEKVSHQKAAPGRERRRTQQPEA